MDPEKTVLAVDDDYQVLIGLERRLSQAGYRVLTATNGQDALDQVRTHLPDAISLDVRLPGDVDGLEVAACLKKDLRTAKIPIIFVTGSADDQFKRRCQTSGGKYFIAKPYDPDLLLQMLSTILATDELAEIKRISSAKRRQPTF